MAMAGDTGLLDHLLKHLADKTVSPEGDKLRRRHNAEGHMEYWLQSAAAAQSGKLPPLPPEYPKLLDSSQLVLFAEVSGLMQLVH